MEHSVLNDATFWFAVSFVVFLVVAWSAGRKAIAGALDSYAAKVKSDLEQATSIHAEAVKLLEDSKAKHEGAVKEAETLVAKAREQAANITAQAERDLEATLKRREAQAIDRIRLLEEQATAEIRAQTVALALKAAESVLRQTVTPVEDQKLVDAQIAAMTASLKKVA